MALTKAHNRMIAGAITNVLDYGAVGDGATDDTTAIQAAIDAVDTAGGGEIFFPAGEYKCNVTLKKYVSLRGEGPLASILKPQFDDHVITFDNTDSVQYLKIESIGIEGDQTFTSQDGIHMTPGAGDRYNFIVFDNLRIRNCGRYGIRGVAAADGTGFPFIQSIHIEHCRIQDCLNAGISFDGRVLESSARDTAIVQNGGTSGANNNAELLLNATWGGGPRRFLFSNCALNHFQAISSGNTGTALKLEGTQQAMVQNCDFESANPFISISNSTSRATTIIGCKLQTTYTIANGIDIDAGRGIYIENNTFSATGTATNAINSNVVEGQVLNINVGSANFFSGYAQAWVDNPETTISSGTASISRTTFTVDTEANAATDDLDNIKNSIGNKAIPDGQVIVFGAANGARTVVVKNGTGNINCGSDITLDNTKDRVMLSYNSASETWSLISFSDNGP